MPINTGNRVKLIQDLNDDNGNLIVPKGTEGKVVGDGFGTYDVDFGELGIHMVTIEYITLI